MSQRVQSYETGELVVTFDPEKCQHTGICLRGLGAVFDIKRTRWIDLKAGSTDTVMAQIDQCPSGALQYIRKA